MSDTTATDNIIQLFSIFGIEKVIYVDDYNNEDITVESIIASSKRNMVFEIFFPELLIGDVGIENSNLRKQWENVNNEKRSEIKNAIQSVTDKEVIPEFIKIIPEKVLVLMNPNSWIQEKESLLKSKHNTLFLFDQELGINERKDDGINIIKEITKDNEIICCLFTQIEQAYNYLEYRDKLSEDYNIRRDNFFVIPKREVSQNQQLFVYLLKLTILCRYFIIFKSRVHGIINNTVRTTKGKIEKISIEDFDHIIFKTPIKEGAWEPDMFYRIYSSFQRYEYNSLIFSDNEIKNAISKIRSVSNIMLKEPKDYLIPSNAWNIQRNELYENVEYLNNNNLPIEVGDIFKDTVTNDYFILLFRPCDLILRTEEGRAKYNKRITLIKITKFEGKLQKNQYEREFLYFGESKNEKWKINFREVVLVQDFILDLCSFNSDGIAKYTSNYELNKNYFRPALISRFSEIKEQINGEINRSDSILAESEIDEDKILKIKKSLYETVFKDDLFGAIYEQNGDYFSLTFNCKRIGRLLYERAIGLLAEYYSVMQRPGYPPHFG